MSDTKPHQQCSCSRNRKCAFHAGQIKQMQKVAKPLHDAQKVEMGIEDLRAKYARQDTPRPQGGGRANRTNRERRSSGWSGRQ